MSLLPEVKRFLEGFSQSAEQQSVEEMRENQRKRLATITDRPQVGRVENLMIPTSDGDLPIRIYTPENPGPYPILVYFHGGGFVMGSLDSHDITCRRIARESGWKVISVQYRLAPEHPFPAAPEDCYAAIVWASRHMEELQGIPDHLAVGGDSSGGALAAAVSLMARDRNGPVIEKQVLLFPNTDFHESVEEVDYPSFRTYGSGYLLTSESLCRFWGFYIQRKGDECSPYASPIRAKDFSNLPATLVITAECDPLRDEGEQFAKRVKEAGGNVTDKRGEGLIHGYLTPEIFEWIAKFLQE